MKFNFAPCLDEAEDNTGRKIPWWADLDAAQRQALALHSLGTTAASDFTDSFNHFDLIVVGAGVAGLSATLAAARLGLSVLCLEAGPVIGLGATGRNAGILCAGINMPIHNAPHDQESGRLWLATAKALDETVALSKVSGSLVKVTQRGGLGLARTKTALKRLQQEAKDRTAAGLNAHMLSVDDVRRMTDGRLNLTGVEAAICYPDEGSIQPLSLLAQTARDAKAAGAKFLGGARVASCERAANQWSVTLSGGEQFKSESLIKAVGPIVAPTARIYALAFELQLPDSFPLFWDAAPYIYYDFRPGNGRVTVSGGRYSTPGYDEATDKSYHQKMATAARAWLPELKGKRPHHTWAVDLEVASDLVPHLTPLDDDNSGLAIEGLGALGVMPGMVLGREAALRLAKLKSATELVDA